MTIKTLWDNGTEKQKAALLGSIYGGKLNYLSKYDYDSLPYGVKERLGKIKSIYDKKGAY